MPFVSSGNSVAHRTFNTPNSYSQQVSSIRYGNTQTLRRSFTCFFRPITFFFNTSNLTVLNINLFSPKTQNIRPFSMWPSQSQFNMRFLRFTTFNLLNFLLSYVIYDFHVIYHINCSFGGILNHDLV